MHKSMPLPVDRDNAPRGYFAEVSDRCRGCAFEDEDFKVCKKKKCMASERTDKRDVIFKEREEG